MPSMKQSREFNYMSLAAQKQSTPIAMPDPDLIFKFKDSSIRQTEDSLKRQEMGFEDKIANFRKARKDMLKNRTEGNINELQGEPRNIRSAVIAQDAKLSSFLYAFIYDLKWHKNIDGKKLQIYDFVFYAYPDGSVVITPIDPKSIEKYKSFCILRNLKEVKELCKLATNSYSSMRVKEY